jgi:rubrerythrin
MSRIASIPELYAHAIAIEREAAERYAELAVRMSDESRDDLAALFSGLAAQEVGHLEALERRTAGIDLPPLARGDYQWLGDAAPESAAHELVLRLMTPRRALLMALGAEQRAQAFFEHVLVTAGDPGLRALAHEMAADEQEHVQLIERMLERTPDDVVHWQDLYES